MQSDGPKEVKLRLLALWESDVNSREHSPIAFIYGSHFISNALLRQYRKLAVSAEGLGDAWLLLQTDGARLGRNVSTNRVHIVSRADILAMGYPMIGPTIVPGHAHFPLLHFYHKHPHYRYYWFIEYDVRFSGDWRALFNPFAEIEADFISAHIHPHRDQPAWPWWDLSHPTKSIEVGKRLRSMNPIYRISARALDCICNAHKDAWRGHFEVLLPTLLNHSGLTVADFGGVGNFVPAGMKNKFYVASLPSREGLLQGGTLRYRPAFVRAGF